MAIRINSASDYYSAAATSAFSLPSGANWSMGAIIKVSATATNSTNNVLTFSTYKAKPSLSFKWQPSNNWYAVSQPLYNGDFYAVDVTQWHVVILQPSSNGSNLEIKTCLINNNSVVYNAHGVPSNESPQNFSSTSLFMGCDAAHDSVKFFDGEIFSAFINVTERMSDQNIINWANGSHLINDLGKSPSAYWILNDTNATTDITGNNHPLTKTGSPTTTNNPEFVSVPSSISVVEFKNKQVFQRNSSNKASIAVSGSCSGTPSSIHARVIKEAGETEAVPWTLLDASPSSGGFSGTVTVPTGGWYKLQVRRSDEITVMASGNNLWAVGDRYGFYGQSQMRQMTHTERGSTGGSSNSKSSRRDAQISENYVSPVLIGENTFLNRIIGKTGVHTAIIAGSVDGEAIAALSKGTSYYNTFVNAVNEGGGCRMVLFNQGGSDSTNGTAKATYRTALNNLKINLLADISGNPTFAIATLARREKDTNESCHAIRSAQIEFLRETTGVYCAGTSADMLLADTSHYSKDGQVLAAERLALAALKELGESTFDASGPKIFSATLTGTNITINISHDAGTNLSGSNFTAIEILDGTTPVTVSSWTRGTNTIIANTSHTFANTAYVRNAYGRRTAAQSVLPLDNAVYATYSGLPLQPTTANIEVGAAGVVTKKVRIKMVLENGVVCANLSNLQYVWFDEAKPQNFTAPKLKGNTGKTDSQGYFELNLIAVTNLPVGGVGYLHVSNTNGLVNQSPPCKSFGLPVEVVE